MKTVTNHLRSKIFNDLGIVNSKTNKTISELMRSEWCYEFEELMRLLLVVGSLRYGELYDINLKDYTEEIKKRLKLYEKTGNMLFLVDVANFALLEFKKGFHPNKHLANVDDQIHFEG